MPISDFSITAGARLHFGLFSVAECGGLTYGGVGMMIDQPQLKIDLSFDDQWTVEREQNRWMTQLMGKWFDAFGGLLPQYRCVQDLPIRLTVRRELARHAGLGSGTQFAFAVAALLFTAFEIPIPSASDLALALGRGPRSAIGSYGFFRGGVLVDRGIDRQHLVAPLDARIEFPQNWRIVLISADNTPGAHGQFEKKTFAEMGRQSNQRRRDLTLLCERSLVPALMSEDYAAFGDALHEFNRSSGEYYSDYQAGCFRDSLSHQIVEDVQRLGVAAVGQSSWGPTMFAVVPSQDRGQRLMDDLKRLRPSIYAADEAVLRQTHGLNHGAKIHCIAEDSYGHTASTFTNE